jgi:hypothetical protein
MDKGHIEFKPYTPMDLQTVFELQVTAEKMYNALQVLLKSKKLKSLLEVNDQKAYEQAKQAVEDYEYKLFHI